ncbi:hypothetical protein [Desulforegula conservatrix]|uniref:hypothetical protein n=1 Tax=Desulforegula conservatrix TaxID=153026 RepID=UPI0004233686|nr:hypothetical protein [Desulforegula conservatrix]
MNNANQIYTPDREVKPGAIVIAQLCPGYCLESHVEGFCGERLILADWSQPVNRQDIKLV